jgi:hypothetical protein
MFRIFRIPEVQKPDDSYFMNLDVQIMTLEPIPKAYFKIPSH